MARKHFLINYHTSTGMPVSGDVKSGEIVVRHGNNNPELMILKDNNEFATFIDKAAIEKIVSDASAELSLDINSAFTGLVTLEGIVNNNHQTIIETLKDYATLTGVSADIVAAKEAVFTSATSVAAQALSAAKQELQNNIDNVSTAVSGVASDLAEFEAEVARDYAKSADVTTAITAAKSDVFTSATSVAAQALSAAKQELQNNIDNVSTAVSALSEDLSEELATKLSAVYKYSGSVEKYEDLPTNLTSEDKGAVYNVEQANGTTPAGTNYVWDGEKWDALAGIVDLSPLATKQSLSDAQTELQNNIDNVSATVSGVASDLAEFKGDVAETYATLTGVSADIVAAKSDVFTSATSVAAQALSAAKQELSERLDDLEAAHPETAVQTITIENLEGVSNIYTGSAITINFMNMVIDGGTF